MIINSVEGNPSLKFKRTDLLAKAEEKRAGLEKDVLSYTNSSPSRVLPFLAALASLLIASCTVGPDFEKPAAPDVSDYTTSPLTITVSSPNVAGGDAQHFAKGMDISADWWTLFHSKPLNDLIEQSLTNNHDLKAAQAALSVARQNVLAQRGAYYPSVSAGFSATKQSQPGTLAPVPSSNAFQYDLFTPQVSVSYVPDVFGLNHRTVESLEAQEQQVRYQMIATYTTLASNVVVTAIQKASVQAQIDATRELVDVGTQILDILKYQLAKGYASGLGGEIRPLESAIAGGYAAEPSFGTRGPASGRASGRG